MSREHTGHTLGYEMTQAGHDKHKEGVIQASREKEVQRENTGQSWGQDKRIENTLWAGEGR